MSATTRRWAYYIQHTDRDEITAHQRFWHAHARQAADPENSRIVTLDEAVELVAHKGLPVIKRGAYTYAHPIVYWREGLTMAEASARLQDQEAIAAIPTVDGS